MLGSSVFGARPHLVLVVAHDRRGPYSALRGLARFVVPRERESAGPRVTGSGRYRNRFFPRAACRVSSWKRKARCGVVWRFYGLPTTPAQNAEACPIANANASPSLRSGSTRRTGLAADRRADKSMRSQRTATGGLAAPRRRPTGPTRPTPTTGQQGYKTDTNGDGRATRMREALETRRTSRQSGRRVGVYVYDAR